MADEFTAVLFKNGWAVFRTYVDEDGEQKREIVTRCGMGYEASDDSGKAQAEQYAADENRRARPFSSRHRAEVHHGPDH